MSVMRGAPSGGGGIFDVSDFRSIDARPPLMRSRISHGRSLWPSMSGRGFEDPRDSRLVVAIRGGRDGRGCAQRESQYQQAKRACGQFEDPCVGVVVR